METIKLIWNWFGNNIAETIAICALFLTAYQAFLSRKHNEVSVQPHLVQYVNRSRGDNQGSIEFIIMNNGLGPAVITQWNLILTDKKLNVLKHDETEELLNKLLEGNKFQYLISTLAAGYVMPANEKRSVLTVTFKLNEKETFNEIERKLNKLDLYVEYESMYGAKFSIST